MRMQRRAHLLGTFVLALIALPGLYALRFYTQDIRERTVSGEIREGMWGPFELERHLLLLRAKVDQIRLGEEVSLDDYQKRRAITLSRVVAIGDLARGNLTFDETQLNLVKQINETAATYKAIPSNTLPNVTATQEILLLLDKMLADAHDLLNLRRQVENHARDSAARNMSTLTKILSTNIILLISVGIGFYWLALREAQLQRQTAEHEKEVAISRARVTMASELHDVLNYHLAIIAQKLNRAHDQLHTNPAITRKEILEARARTGLALRDTRDSVHALRSGMIQPLDQAIKALDSGGMDLRLEIAGQPRTLPDDLAFAAYRITQEAFANTIKHARQATRIDVRLDYGSEHFILTIEDDGSVLYDDRQDEQAKTSMGLIGMQERVEQLRGTFKHGRTNHGYFIRANFPTEPTSYERDSRFDCGRPSDLQTNNSHEP